MSSPNRYTLRLSRQAEADLESILQYTYETYGERQRQIYADALHEAYETITGNPGLGHRRPDLSERHLAFHVEHHFVVYTVSGQTVNMSRILYERMGFTRHVRH